jgi:hypothetical protein
MPTQFSFDAAKWQDWKRTWERFRVASALDNKSQARQISTLLYCMGTKAEDIYSRFVHADEETYADVIGNFDQHFALKRNIIFERVQFNRRVQQPRETADDFIVALHKLAETCEYGTLRDQLVRDRLVAGLRDAHLSERLQLDPELTLEKAVTMVRQSELVRHQQTVLRSSSPLPTADVNAIQVRRNQSHNVNQSAGNKSKSAYRQKQTGLPVSRSGDVQFKCKWCGSSEPHTRVNCKAKLATCNSCSKTGHYSSVCRSKPRYKSVQAIHTAQSLSSVPASHTSQADALFIDTVVAPAGQSQSWFADVAVDNATVHFRLDTGADATVIPTDVYRALFNAPLRPIDTMLLGPSRMPLNALGSFSATLGWKNATTKQIIYVVSGLHQPLLGRDAINELGLATCLAAVNTSVVDAAKPRFDPKLEYADRFTGLGRIPGTYRISLLPEAKPYAIFTPRRVPINLLQPLKLELERLEKAHVISRIDTPTEWCAPIVVVPKRPQAATSGSGSLTPAIRLCVDYSRLNEFVQRPVHGLPIIDQLLAQLTGATVFSKIDCSSSFHQVVLDEQSVPLTCFLTPFGRFVYHRLPYGILSGTDVYQSKMAAILHDVTTAILVDDVLIYGRTQQEHDDRLRAVMERLRRHNVTLNDKCIFSVPEIKWAGYIISGSGVQPDPDRVRAVVNMSPPKNVTEVRCFLGMVNQLAKFANNLAQQSAPIRDLLRKDRVWTWDVAQQTAFDNIKRLTVSTPVLAHYNSSLPTIVAADSSSFGLGAVLLQQQTDNTWRPVTFASRSLTDVERRYAQVEKECLALTWACERLADYLVGIRFQLQTDHKPLVSLLSPQRALDDVPPRIQRLRIRLMRYDYSVVYVAGSSMGTADTLSRFPLANEPQLIDSADVVERYISFVINSLPVTDILVAKVRAASATDDVIQQVLALCRDEWPSSADQLPVNVRPFWHTRNELSAQHDLLLHGQRLVIPSSLRAETLTALHTAGHLGIEKCRAKARSSVWWPKIGRDIERFVSSCVICQHWARDRAEPLLSTALPALPWQRVAMDLFEMDGRHYLVVVDYYSRYLEVVRLPNQTTDAVIRALKVIWATHGVAMEVQSDGGPCFRSDQFQQFADAYGFVHTKSSPRYAPANGAAERAVQTAKAMLRKADDLQMAMLAYRTTPIIDGYSPAQLLMGRQLRTTVPTASFNLQPKTPNPQTVRQHDRQLKNRQATYFNRRHRARNGRRWMAGERVWIRDAQTEATVTKALPFRSYELRTTSGYVIRRNGRAIRPALPTTTTTTASTAPLTSSTVANAGRCHIRDIPPVPPQQPTGNDRRQSQQLPRPLSTQQQHQPQQRQQQQHQRLQTGVATTATTSTTRAGRPVRKPERYNI